jgi:threonyl-tRNA synthetase
MTDIDKIRHSLSHILATAVTRRFKGAKLGIGPTIENGFYYDFDLPKPLTSADIKIIHQEMLKILKQEVVFKKSEKDYIEAVKIMKDQPYKLELIKELADKGEKISFYQSGSFIDLCAGPHISSSKEIVKDAFLLTKIAGAYWRGSEKNKMLQRIYGVAFSSKKELDEYIRLQEEAEKRDHRKIGKEQELFFVDDLAGKGLIMWQPNGTIIRNEIEKLALEAEEKDGYVRVVTPHLGKEELYLTSGHLPYYKHSMYPAMKMDDGTYYLKAMNCPHHHLIYRHKMRSYRDLPVRIAEYGTCYRNELSGTLAGLLRVRALAMNDAHIYCTKDQIKKEFSSVLKLTMNHFKIFGLKNYWFRLSKWSPKHLEKYVNQPKNWEYTEKIIREVLKDMKVKFTEADDEAAFYGPKVDVQFKSIIGREETMSTIQLDFVAKERFGLSYTDEKGHDNNEVFVIHRAPLSTHERFLAFLIEHYAGAWPVWLSPNQVAVLSVGTSHKKHCEKLAKEFKEQKIRVYSDLSNETVGNKIRKAILHKIPYLLVIGDKEMKSKNLMVRFRGEKEAKKISKSSFIKNVREKINSRALDL